MNPYMPCETCPFSGCDCPWQWPKPVATQPILNNEEGTDVLPIGAPQSEGANPAPRQSDGA